MKNLNMKPLNHEGGSATLMVILIVFCLMMFGVLAMMSAYAEFKLSSKYASWTREYYSLDAEGLELLLEAEQQSYDSSVDQILTSPHTEQKLRVKFVKENGELEVLKWQQLPNSFEFEGMEELWDGEGQ